MNNYYSREHSLTKATKTLWENKPVEVCMKAQDNKVELFQRERLFAVIRNQQHA